MGSWKLLCGALLLWACPSFAQYAGMGELIYPEKLWADLDVVRDAIHQAHPDPYRYVTKGELDQEFDALRDSIRTPLTTDRFVAKLMPVLQRIGDGGLRVELDQRTMQRIREQSTMLPLRVRLIEESLYIEEELKGFRTFPPGSRIVSVNGISAARILSECGAWVIADGANESRRRFVIEKEIPLLFVLTYGNAAAYVVEVETPDGRRMEEVLTGMREEEMQRMRKPEGVAMHPWRSTWESETATLWVTLSSLDPDVLARSGQRPASFLTAMRKELEVNKARNLVIDIRGCTGTELAVAEQVFAAVALAPFRIVQGMTSRPGPWQSVEGMVDLPDQHVASIGRNYLPARHGVVALRPDDPRLALLDPRKSAFRGTVFVVCDGGTRQAAAALAMLAKRSGRARLVGEETGSNAHSFTGGHELAVTMPNSGVKLHVPLVRYLPDGSPDGPADHGEQPRHSAHQQPWGVAKGRDTVKMALIEMIRALQ
ncbi:MAG: hypothetical protein IPM46_13820 [Flavobacteriales bacterium]|nr:hypothetical protein [Flavobacteriales bacterium]